MKDFGAYQRTLILDLVFLESGFVMQTKIVRMQLMKLKKTAVSFALNEYEVFV